MPFIPSKPPATLPETTLHSTIIPPSLPVLPPTPTSISAPAVQSTPASTQVPQQLPSVVPSASGTPTISDTQAELIPPQTVDSENDNNNIQTHNEEVNESSVVSPHEQTNHALMIPKRLNDDILT